MATPTDEQLEKSTMTNNVVLGLLLTPTFVAAGVLINALDENVPPFPAGLAITAVALTLIATLLGLARNPRASWEVPAEEQEQLLRDQAAVVLWKQQWRRVAVGGAFISVPVLAWVLALAYA